jgi:hypothetical protein
LGSFFAISANIQRASGATNDSGALAQRSGQRSTVGQPCQVDPDSGAAACKCSGRFHRSGRPQMSGSPRIAPQRLEPT